MSAAPKACPKINEDVAYELMLYIGPKEQATMAQVASCWTGPARRVLYRSITIHTWERAPESSEQRLTETLRSHAHLRALVRQIAIHSAEDKEPLSQVDWVDLLPQNSLRSFTYVCCPRASFTHELLQKDAIRTVSHLTANGPDTFPALKACFELPMMETLELDLSKWAPRRDRGDRPILERRLQLDAAKVPKLKHLYIRVSHIRDDVILIIIAAFAAQLQSLHIHVPPGRIVTFDVKAKAAWTEEFLGHIRRGKKLTHLVFSGFLKLFPRISISDAGAYQAMLDAVMEQAVYGPMRQKRHLHPFLDGVAQQSAVEHLCCIDYCYTEKLFRKLSSRVKVLEFYAEAAFEFEAALLELLGRVRKDGLRLRMVRFFACEEGGQAFGTIEAACKENGVGFEFVSVVAPLHHPPTRPAVL